jgi:hypothetical protein
MTESNAADAAAAPAAPLVPKEPFQLRGKQRVQHGARAGKVLTVRGNRDIPYDVEILFDGEKYPQWFQYGTLRLFYEKGVFQLL